MNEEREDTELAELLKQLPAPTRLDDARRNAIFTALPQGRAPRKPSYSWSRFLRFAALLVLVGGVLGGLLFPAGPLALEHARKVKTANAASMSLREEKADYSYGVEMDALVDEPSTAPPAVTAPAAAAPAKPAAFDVSGSRSHLPQEKKRVGDKWMDSDAFAADLSERAPEIAFAEAEPPPPTAPRPAEMKSVAIVKSPIVMRGIVHGAKTARSTSLARERRNAPQGQQAKSAEAVELPLQEALQKAEEFADATLGDIRLKAVSAGESLARAEGAEMAEAVAGKDSADDWKRNFSALGAEVADAPADVSVATASAQPVLSSEGRAGVAQDAAEMKGGLAARGGGGIEPAGGLHYARSDSGRVAEKPVNAAMKAEDQLLPASEASAMVAQDLAEAVDSDGYDFYSEGTVYKVKRKGSGESRDKNGRLVDAIAAADRKPESDPREALQEMEQRASQVTELDKLVTLENPRGEILNEYRDARQKEVAKELPVSSSDESDVSGPVHEAEAVLNEEVLVERMEKKLEEKPAPADFGLFTLIPTAEHPLSTFGLDVDSAGYSRAVSLIDEGARPDAAAIRQEEFINAFDYGDLAPAEATFRVYLEGAASPFRPGNHLLRVGVKGRRLGREEQRPLVLTILLDASGSMDTPERMALAKRAIRALLGKLSLTDTVTLLTCSDKTRRIFSRNGWGMPDVMQAAEASLESIRCQGATNLEDGIVRAFESASADFTPKAENRVVILSDGIANLGSANAEEILAKVAANRDRGISCSVIGVGRSTYNDTLLEAMANRGNGQYRFLDSEASIHESFVEDLQNSFNTIAADVKIQVEWNAAAVKAYRSHGYDSRALKDEQFRDDSVDAGEVGSGQGVTVVYEMQLEEGLKSAATLGTVRIRYRRVDTGAVEEIEAPIAAEAVQHDFARARPQFRLACAVAEFATALKHVPPAAQANALQPVAAEATRSAAELDYYAPARGFADAVRKLMGIGL